MTASIGIDIGGTKCLGVRLDGAGQITAEARLPTPRTGAELVAVVAELVAALGGDASVPVGVGAPGLVDRTGHLRFAPHLRAIADFALRAELERARPGTRFVVDNDATCAAWAETTVGAAVGRADVLMVTIGTGIGGGIVADGRLHRGHHGFAGEIGHVLVSADGPPCPCGKRGCWERYASGSGLGWMAREAALGGQLADVVERAGGDPEAVRGEDVTAAAEQGDAEAVDVVRRFTRWVAVGLANLANILDPEIIVLGGGIVESGAVFLAPTRAAFGEFLEGAGHRPPIDVVLAALGERAGAVGAALLAAQEAG